MMLPASGHANRGCLEEIRLVPDGLLGTLHRLDASQHPHGGYFAMVLFSGMSWRVTNASTGPEELLSLGMQTRAVDHFHKGCRGLCQPL